MIDGDKWGEFIETGEIMLDGWRHDEATEKIGNKWIT